MKLSRFCYIIPIENDVIALWNSLWLRVVYVQGEMCQPIRQVSSGNNFETLTDFVDSQFHSQATQLDSDLIKEKMIVQSDDADFKKLSELIQATDSLPIGIMYLILATDCNLRCSYCYLARSISGTQCRKNTRMSPETARQAIELMTRVATFNGSSEAEYIFYGGEPFLNIKAMKAAIERSKDFPSIHSILTVNTNATLINNDLAQFLKDHGVLVAVSIDGPKDIHDSCRVDATGNGSFNKTIRGYEILQRLGVNTNISCTVTPRNVSRIQETVEWLINDLGAESIDLNLMLGKFDTEEERAQYAHQATQAILSAHSYAKEHGIHFERVMKIVRALSTGYVAFNSCAGCGQQIVVKPNGSAGTCQGLLNQESAFVPNMEIIDYSNHPLWTKWRRRSPFNIGPCLDCEALGICGGGCPYSSMLNTGDIMDLDTVHCTFAKGVLKYSLKELWSNMSH